MVYIVSILVGTVVHGTVSWYSDELIMLSEEVAEIMLLQYFDNKQISTVTVLVRQSSFRSCITHKTKIVQDYKNILLPYNCLYIIFFLKYVPFGSL